MNDPFPNTQSSRDLANLDFGYQYPKDQMGVEYDFRPTRKLHDSLVRFVMDRAKEGHSKI